MGIYVYLGTLCQDEEKQTIGLLKGDCVSHSVVYSNDSSYLFSELLIRAIVLERKKNQFKIKLFAVWWVTNKYMYIVSEFI